MNSFSQQQTLQWGLRLAVLWCFVLVALGAFVRLSDAGLGCPDWPTCYGKLTWPTQAAEVASANLAFPERPVEHHKTWPEQIHRHVAAGLGLLVLLLNILARRMERQSVLPIFIPIAAIAAGIVLYTKQQIALASIVAGLGELALLVMGLIALRNNSSANTARLTLLLALICFQALLGKWTVTLLLKPIVVTSHLIFGLLTLASLLWCSLRVRAPSLFAEASKPRIAVWGVRAALAILLLQIFLGGWVSTNYAALACPDFPRCHGQWWPKTDFAEGFVLVREIGVDYEGGILDGDARTAVHMAHRIGAVLASGAILLLVWFAFRRGLKSSASVMLLLLITQVALGISNVWFSLPLPVAVSHNAVAALLLCSLVYLSYQNLYGKSSHSSLY